MIEPHETREAAEAAVHAFFADVSAAREKHRIAEVVLLTETIFSGDDGVNQRRPYVLRGTRHGSHRDGASTWL